MEAVDDLDDPDREEESEHNWHVSELPEDVDELEIDAVITPDGMWYGSDGGAVGRSEMGQNSTWAFEKESRLYRCARPASQLAAPPLYRAARGSQMAEDPGTLTRTARTGPQLPAASWPRA
ncbi:MAG: hypothetical protein KatS3mg057_2857 [Herpetosiphonaceae bacterium]|nr:MAG: hypothetical protein KatS3mg057_2857 [Herpetosiphonaceae bacterium]